MQIPLRAARAAGSCARAARASAACRGAEPGLGGAALKKKHRPRRRRRRRAGPGKEGGREGGGGVEGEGGGGDAGVNFFARRHFCAAAARARGGRTQAGLPGAAPAGPPRPPARALRPAVAAGTWGHGPSRPAGRVLGALALAPPRPVGRARLAPSPPRGPRAVPAVAAAGRTGGRAWPSQRRRAASPGRGQPAAPHKEPRLDWPGKAAA